MTTGIYKITNTQTQKSYIGQSERVAQFKDDKLIKIYNSASEADAALKVSKGSVSKAVRGIQHTVKGFTFEYVEDCENG